MMPGRATRRRIGTALSLVAAAALLGGCKSIGGFTGAAAGVATGAVSTNPAVGIAVGIAVKAATDETVNYVLRRMHGDEQDEIAGIVGTLGPDEQKAWEVKHSIPYGNEHGEVRVTRVFATPLANCKEFAFSVIDGKDTDAKASWYFASACQQGAAWKWAVAEPAVDRWGSLQ
jgi:hypothetical protein